MQLFVLFALVASAMATGVVYTPTVYNTPTVYTHPSTFVKSNQLGGNFAYSVQSAPAYVNPVYTYGVKTPVTYTQAVQPLTYSSVLAAGTPAHTYKTVAGVSPIYYNGLNTYPYAYTV